MAAARVERVNYGSCVMCARHQRQKGRRRIRSARALRTLLFFFSVFFFSIFFPPRLLRRERYTYTIVVARAPEYRLGRAQGRGGCADALLPRPSMYNTLLSCAAVNFYRARVTL